MKPFTLVGVDGNAFCVIAYTKNAMRKAGFTRQQMAEYQNEVTKLDYDYLIVKSMDILDECNEKLGLSDSIYGNEYSKFAEFGPGKYFIGDICYALPDDVYDTIWGDKYKYEDGFFKEYGFAVHRTEYGDGIYEGTDSVSYYVDAGVIGITDIGKEQRYEDKELNRLGKIVEVKDSIIMNCNEKCNFQFIIDGKSFEIITDGSDYEDEDEEYEY